MPRTSCSIPAAAPERAVVARSSVYSHSRSCAAPIRCTRLRFRRASSKTRGRYCDPCRIRRPRPVRSARRSQCAGNTYACPARPPRYPHCTPLPGNGSVAQQLPGCARPNLSGSNGRARSTLGGSSSCMTTRVGSVAQSCRLFSGVSEGCRRRVRPGVARIGMAKGCPHLAPLASVGHPATHHTTNLDMIYDGPVPSTGGRQLFVHVPPPGRP